MTRNTKNNVLAAGLIVALLCGASLAARAAEEPVKPEHRAANPPRGASVAATESPGADTLIQLGLADARQRLQEMLAQREARYQAWGRPRVNVKIDPTTINHREGFRIAVVDGQIAITGGGYGGAIYGVQELGRLLEKHETMPANLKVEDQPDFPIRGATIYFMNTYLSPIPEYFHDRELLTRYLDYLHENRFNTLFVWHGHLFSQIMELPEYPDATTLSKEELAKNEAQFRWLTDECAKRNIDVLLHFYNILIPTDLAKARGIPSSYDKPNEFVSKYIGYTLERFMRQFKSVGLYICPGEALDREHQRDWFRDVIFAAAKRSGQHPLLVVRAWHCSTELLQSCREDYDRVYTELKHNDELVVSPYAELRHKGMLSKGLRHIANMHLNADVTPFRWGSWRYIHEIVNDWKTTGLSGGEIQHLVNWPWRGPSDKNRGNWPYTMDKLEPHQKLGDKSGKKLIIYERDWIWYDAFARYLWKVERDPEQDQAYWRSRLEAKFGTAEAAEALDDWYRLAGPILPNLNNLNGQISGYATTATANMTAMNTLVKDYSHYWLRPLDPWAFARYREKFGLEKPWLSAPKSRPGENTEIPYPTRVFYYVQKKLAGEDLSHYVTPDRLTETLVEMAEESLAWAKKAERAATKNKEEAARFVTDSEALILVARMYRHFHAAAIAKRLIMDTGDKEKYAAEFLREMDATLTEYEKLRGLTAGTYMFCNELKPINLNWDFGLDTLRKDFAEQKAWLKSFSKETAAPASPPSKTNPKQTPKEKKDDPVIE